MYTFCNVFHTLLHYYYYIQLYQNVLHYKDLGLTNIMVENVR